MKILMIIDSLIRGGRERRMIELLKGLKSRGGIEVEIVIFSRIVSYPEVYDLGFPVHMLERKPKKDPRVFFRFFRLCRRFRPDLVHSWGTMPTIYAIPAVKLLGIPLINATIADAPANLNWRDSRFSRAQLTFPFSDVILGNSEAGLRAYRAPRRKSRCIYNGIDPDRVKQLEDPTLVRRGLGIQEGRVVGMVGAFYDRKDYETFLRAAMLVLHRHKDVTFLAVGNGPNLEKCRRLVGRAYVNRILFPGELQKVESVVNIFDIGVLATNAHVHGEGISNAIVEYMLLKKPVIASEGGGTPEIVMDGQTGFLVPPSSPEAVAEKIEYLLTHPETARQMGENGARKIRTHFSLEKMKQQYLDLYDRLLAGRHYQASI